MPPDSPTIVLIDCSPNAPGTTAATLERVQEELDHLGADCTLVAVRDGVGHSADLVARSEGIVLGTPVFAGTYSHLTKALLDECASRRFRDEATFEGTPVLVVATAGGAPHFQVLGDLARILFGFYSAFLVPSGIYWWKGLPEDSEFDNHIGQQVRALLQLSECIRRSEALSSVRPQF